MRYNSLYSFKNQISLYLSFILVFLLFSGCSGIDLFSKAEFKLSRFNQITITDNDNNSSTYKDESKMGYYIEVFNNAEPVDNDIHTSGEALSEYRVMMEGKKPKHTREITMYLDENLENRNLFIIINDEPKRIGEEYFSSLLTEPIFEPIYALRSPPKIVIQNGLDEYKPDPNSYEWKFRKTDNNYYDSSFNQSGGSEGINITIKDSKLPEILSEENPDNVKWSFFQGNKEIFVSENIQNGSFSLSDGAYQCSLELKWLENKNRGFYGKAQFDFTVQVDNPPEISISALKTYPGELLVITANHVNQDENVTITTDIDFTPNVFAKGSERVILLPVSYFHKANQKYGINVAAGDISKTFEVEVLDKEFTTQYLVIDTKVAAATRNDESAREVTEKIAPLRPVCDDEQYWEGAFIQPVEGGRVRAYDFGKRRHVNNAPTSYRHNGLDIGQDEGTPVKAVNNGRVLIADYLIGTGYTVIIEHGYGLKSWYYHMVSLNVKTGDMVKKGDIIGLVGSTGFSTGPHLHLAISVNHIYVNPMPFFEQGVPMLTHMDTD